MRSTMVLLLYLWENVRKWSSYESFDTFDLEKGGSGVGCLDLTGGSSSDGGSYRDNEHVISNSDALPDKLTNLDISVVSILPEQEGPGYQQVCPSRAISIVIMAWRHWRLLAWSVVLYSFSYGFYVYVGNCLFYVYHFYSGAFPLHVPNWLQYATE